MKKLLLLSIIGVLFATISSCTRIDAGHVGLKVNMSGSDKGVSQTTSVTGWCTYMPGLTQVVEFPVYVQTKKYPEIHVTARGGSQFEATPQITYQVKTEKVPAIYQKYRLPLQQLEDGFMELAVNKVFRDVTNEFVPDSLISSRTEYENYLFTALSARLDTEGFVLTAVTSNLTPPQSLVDAINNKNKAIQDAQTAQNQIATIQAEAKKTVAEAQGKATALVTQAQGEAEANRLRQQSLTPLLIQQQWIAKWDGQLSQTSLGANATPMFNVGK